MSQSPALFRRLIATTAVIAALGVAPLIAEQGGANAASAQTRIGLSIVGGSQSSINTAIKMFPNAKVGRYFAQTIQPFNSSSLRYFPASMEVWISWNTSPALVASGAYDSTFATILQSWNASGHTIKWSWTHEATCSADCLRIARTTTCCPGDGRRCRS